MIIYLLSCLSSMGVIYLCKNKFHKQTDRPDVIFFSALPMILVASFRYDVGRDYLHTYVPYFEMVQNHVLSESKQLELLYHYLNKFVACLQGDYFWVFTVCAILFYILVYCRIAADSPNPVLSVFLLSGMGYVFVFFNAMRQMVGAAILLYSLRYVKERKIFPFLICNALAAGFHISCLVFLPVYFIRNIRLKPVIALVITLVLTILGELVSQFVRNVIALTQFSGYLSSEFDTGKTAFVVLAINVVLFVLYSLCYQQEEQYQLYYNLQLIALWTAIFSGKVVLFLRVFWIFGLPSIISLPYVLETLPIEKDRKLVASIVFIFYLAYMLYTVGVQNSNSVLPYQTIFSRWL